MIRNNVKKLICILFATIFMLESVTIYATEQERTDVEYTYISDVKNESKNSEDSTNAYIEELGLTRVELQEAYNIFLEENPSMCLDQETDVLNAFVDYAITKGIIEDTQEQRTATLKETTRNNLLLVVAGGNALGYTTASDYLEHSLQDNPGDLYYLSGTKYATQIYNSSEFAQIRSSFLSKVKGTSHIEYYMSGSTTLSSTTDLKLAYNKVAYTVDGRKNNGVWTVTVTFTDTYDFEYQPWKNAMTNSALVTILNNYAASGQNIGAVVPYDIKVVVKYTFNAI